MGCEEAVEQEEGSPWRETPASGSNGNQRRELSWVRTIRGWTGTGNTIGWSRKDQWSNRRVKLPLRHETREVSLQRRIQGKEAGFTYAYWKAWPLGEKTLDQTISTKTCWGRKLFWMWVDYGQPTSEMDGEYRRRNRENESGQSSRNRCSWVVHQRVTWTEQHMGNRRWMWWLLSH